MGVKVVDASALGAMLFGEPEGEAVLKRLGTHTIAAPTLLRYEVGNIAWKKARAHPDRRDDILAVIDVFGDLALEEVEAPMGPVVELAAETGLTVYDASYLWLARGLRAELVTLDKRLQAAAVKGKATRV